MSIRTPLSSQLSASIVAAVLFFSGNYAGAADKVIDVQNDEIDVTLFRGAANNSYFPVYFWLLRTLSNGDCTYIDPRRIDLQASHH